MPTTERIAILGAGGHAKVVLSTLQALGYTVVVVLDDDERKWGRLLLGVPIEGPMDSVRERHFEAGVIAIGDNAARKRLAERFPLRWVGVVHPSAWVHSSVRLGVGSVVFAGAVVQPDTVVGEHAIINTGATVDHDCELGPFAHVAPGVHLAGGVKVGEGAFLGIGSAVIPGVRVGAWSTVGAGGVVVRDVPDRVLVVGVPARPVAVY